MANALKMAIVQSIKQLHAAGWSQRRIARELEIDRGTVARYLRPPPPDPKPAIPPAGSAGSNAATFSASPGSATTRRLVTMAAIFAAASNAAIPPAGSGHENHGSTTPAGVRLPLGRPDAVRAVSRADSRQARSAALGPADLARPGRRARLHGQLRQREAVRAAAGRSDAACRSGGWNARPAMEAQVDFGTGAPVIGARRQAAEDARLSDRAESQPQRRTASRRSRRRPMTFSAPWRMPSRTSAACPRRWSSTISKRLCCIPIGSIRC